MQSNNEEKQSQKKEKLKILDEIKAKVTGNKDKLGTDGALFELFTLIGSLGDIIGREFYVEYNGGSPQVIVSSSEFDEAPDKIKIGVASNEDGTMHLFNLGVRLDESIGQAGRFIRRVFGVSRDARRGGLIFGETGTRNVTLTTGTLWWGRTEYPITAVDTSSSGTFNIYYRDSPSGFLKTANQSQWDNLNYDDGTGTLNT
ncbi:hypothetical protein LCGC14_3153080, partial [marine sediment metagenome]